MYVEVEFSLDVVGTELAKTKIEKHVSLTGKLTGQSSSSRVSDLLGFIPGDNVRQPYLVHSCEESQYGEDERRNKEFVFVECG
jgi:hypothetical protein